MSLKEQIDADFMAAFKNKDMVTKTFLGVLRGEIQLEAGRGIPPTDESVMAILRKMEKSLKQTNTPQALSELEMLNPYLPKLMSEDEIREIILGYKNNGTNTMGELMGCFTRDHKGLADNKVVASVILDIQNEKEILQ